MTNVNLEVDKEIKRNPMEILASVNIKEDTKEAVNKSKYELAKQQLLSELLETERKYVQDLEEVCDLVISV